MTPGNSGRVALTLYPTNNWRRYVQTIARVRPQALVWHSFPGTLAQAGAVTAARRELDALVAALVAAGWTDAPQALAFWMAVGIDGRAAGDKPGDYLRRRVAAADAAVALGMPRIQWNAESRWNDLPGPADDEPGHQPEDARAVIQAVRAKHPTLVQTVSGQDQPGHHPRYPWAAWDEADGWDPQVYGAFSGGRAAARFRDHDAHWKRAIRLGILKDREPNLYVSGYSCRAMDTTWAADQRGGDVLFWCLNRKRLDDGRVVEQLDEEGQLAAMMLSACYRQGFRGAGRFARFQAALGQKPDGKGGQDTLRAFRAALAGSGLPQAPVTP